MITHPLEVIERLIDVELRRRTYTREEFETFIRTLRRELDNHLNGPVYSGDMNLSKEKWQEHIRLHQYSLFRLMDTIVNYLPEEELQHLEQFNPAFELQDCYKMIFDYLQNHLLDMHMYHSEQVDIDYPVPSFYFKIDEEEFKANLRLLRDKIYDAGIDGEYWAMIRRAFNVLFLSNGISRISYKQLLYLEKLQKKLIELLSENNDVLAEKLQYWLIYMDFNDPRYVSFVKGLIKKEIDIIPSYLEKRKRLLYLQHEVSQVVRQKSMSYMAAELSLRIQLVNWMKEWLTRMETEPLTLKLEDLDPETAMLIQQTSALNMSASQLNRYLEIIMDEDFYVENKEKVDYLFSTFCKTAPEDNPDVEKIFSALKVVVKLKKFKSRLWI